MRLSRGARAGGQRTCASGLAVPRRQGGVARGAEAPDDEAHAPQNENLAEAGILQNSDPLDGALFI